MRLMPYTNAERIALPEQTEAQRAFANALDEGRLSLDESAWNYVGHYMHMGRSPDGQHESFKHRLTREYLKPLGETS
jgi:hypothetical protein